MEDLPPMLLQHRQMNTLHLVGACICNCYWPGAHAQALREKHTILLIWVDLSLRYSVRPLYDAGTTALLLKAP